MVELCYICSYYSFQIEIIYIVFVTCIYRGIQGRCDISHPETLRVYSFLGYGMKNNMDC